MKPGESRTPRTLSPASPGAPRLPRAFFARQTMRVARDLLGAILVRGGPRPVAARIVETEAYHGPPDAASHAHRGRTPRNAPMFGPPGRAYVYQIYGMWCCLNVVTMRETFPAAVLLRAVELPGDPRGGAGPGKLCRALGIGRSFDGADLVAGDALWIASDGLRVPAARVARGPRVNVAYAGTWAARPWRFWIAGHPSVSR